MFVCFKESLLGVTPAQGWGSFCMYKPSENVRTTSQHLKMFVLYNKTYFFDCCICSWPLGNLGGGGGRGLLLWVEGFIMTWGKKMEKKVPHPCFGEPLRLCTEVEAELQ